MGILGRAVKSKLVLITVVCLAAAAAAQQLRQEAPQRSRARVYVLEGLGALGGTLGCGCLGAGAAVLLLAEGMNRYSTFEPGSDQLYVASVGVGLLTLVAAPAAVAQGAVLVGKKLGEDGSRSQAFVCAYAGEAVGAGLVVLGFGTIGATNKPGWAVPLFVAGALAMPAGAVYGYNTGVRREAPAHGFEGRLELPAVALTGVELPDHSVEYGVKVQLAGLRF